MASSDPKLVDDGDKAPWEGELENEVERMTKDADALMESIREVASPKPKEKTPAAKVHDNSLESSLEKLEKFKAILEPPKYELDDDDISDAGTLPDELKAALSEELQHAEESFAKFKKEAKNEKTQVAPTKAATKPLDKSDNLLILALLVVWFLVAWIASVARDRMIDEEGKFVLYSRLLESVGLR